MRRLIGLIGALLLAISLNTTDLSSIQDSMRITSLEKDIDLCDSLIKFFGSHTDQGAINVVNDMRKRKASKLIIINNLRDESDIW